MSAVTAKVAGIKPIGAGKVAQIGFDINGAIETRKAWATEKDGSPSWVEGQTYTIEFFEQENNFNGNTTMEKWAKKAQAPRPGGGGRPAPKADPERTAIERERLNTYQQNSEINRQRDDYKQCLIIAQVCAKAAVDIHLNELQAQGGEFDSAKVALYASEVGAVITKTADEIQNQLTITPNGGGR
jgi:hypothetical protein